MRLEFSVHELNRDLFEARIERLQSACEVHNTLFKLERIGTEVIKVDKVMVDEETGKKTIVSENVAFDNYILEYEEPDNVRYAYVGLLRKVGNKNILDIDLNFKRTYLDNTEDYDIGIPEEIYTVEMECEHCHSGRELKKSHVIFDLEEDVFFQAATGCLSGYTYFNREVDVKMNLESLNIEYERTSLDGGSGRIGYDYSILDDFLLHSLTYYLEQDDLTYIPRSSASFDGKKKCSIQLVQLRMAHDEDILEEANELLEQLKHFLSTDSNIEQPNTSIMVEENLVPKFKEGYLIYQVFRFLKSLENDVYVPENEGKEKEKKESNYVGVVGEKLEVEATFTRQIEFDTPYGTVGMNFFETDDGDVLLWRTAKWVDADEGDRFILKGKVKAHDTFRDVKQTHINYVKMFEVKTEEVNENTEETDTKTKSESKDTSNLDENISNFLKFQ